MKNGRNEMAIKNRDSKGRFIKGHTISKRRIIKQRKIMKKLYISRGYNRFFKNTGKTRFKKGQEPWNKYKVGYLSGENHYNWKGGITKLNQVIRQCFKYKSWRDSVFLRDNYTCQECKENNCYIHAHHKKMFNIITSENNIQTLRDAINCDELWDINNGITLCKKCHNEMHKGDKK